MTEQPGAATPAPTSGGVVYVTAAATIPSSDLPTFYRNVAEWLSDRQDGKSFPRLVGGEDYVAAVVTVPADRLPDFYTALAEWLEPEDPARGKSFPR